MIWLILALLTLLAAGFVIYPLLRTSPKPFVEDVYGASAMVDRANVALFNEQLAELDRQLNDGDIDTAQHSELVAEQKRLLLVDSEGEAITTAGDAASAANATRAKPGRGAWLLMLSLFLVPLIALSVYQMLGASDDVEISSLLKKRASVPMSAEEGAALSKTLQSKISQRLKKADSLGREGGLDTVFYSVTLARLFMDENRFSEAVDTYQQAVRLSPNDPDLMAEYAQALYFVAGNTFQAGAGMALDNALALDPNNRTALGLQGIRAFEAGDYRLAMVSWQSALRGVPPESAQAQALQSGILRARKQLGEDMPSLEVTVSLSPSLVADEDQVVYVFAREWKGMPMPLAVAKLTVKDLPATVTLDDSMAMAGGRLLSSVAEVDIVARVSSTGSAIPAEGDLEGSTGALKMNNSSQSIKVVIDRQR